MANSPSVEYIGCSRKAAASRGTGGPASICADESNARAALGQSLVSFSVRSDGDVYIVDMVFQRPGEKV